MSVSEGTPRTLNVEFLGVEMSKRTGDDSCSSCDKTRVRLVQAIEKVQPLFDQVGVTPKIVDRWIGSEQEARRERVGASPTIRIGSVEVKPRHIDNSEDGRLWEWQGKDYAQPPAGLLVDLLMRGYAQAKPVEALDASAISPYLKQFFQAAHDCCASTCCQ